MTRQGSGHFSIIDRGCVTQVTEVCNHLWQTCGSWEVIMDKSIKDKSDNRFIIRRIRRDEYEGLGQMTADVYARLPGMPGPGNNPNTTPCWRMSMQGLHGRVLMSLWRLTGAGIFSAALRLSGRWLIIIPGGMCRPIRDMPASGCLRWPRPPGGEVSAKP